MTVRVPADLVARDPAVLAPVAGLVYLPDSEPGIARRRRGTAMSYSGPTGARVAAADVERIEQLAIPPAWTGVWISPDPDGHLQASGVDDAGRKQYRYHERFRELCDTRKFARLAYFGRAVVKIRRAVAGALEQPPGSQLFATGAVVRLIDRSLLRVGNDESAANGHYGASTLTADHVVDDGYVTLEYAGKGGQERQLVIEDDHLADVLTTLASEADDELFWYSEGGERRRITATDINRFVVEHGGTAFSAKDFRTWGGSRAALEARLAGDDPVRAADAAADELGNTRAVARSSYIHPTVLEAERDSLTELWDRSRSSTWRDRSESALAKLLTQPSSS